MALRNIRILGDEILRKKCKPVDKIDERILSLLQDMLDILCNTENGAAIAAPQVGVLKRVIVIDMGQGTIIPFVYNKSHKVKIDPMAYCLYCWYVIKKQKLSSIVTLNRVYYIWWS